MGESASYEPDPTRQGSWQALDLGLPSLQSCDKFLLFINHLIFFYYSHQIRQPPQLTQERAKY
jgi:hypothetical protein